MSQPSTTSIQNSGPLQAGNVPNYANEHDPSWEEVIAMVVIPGQPGAIRNAAGQWEVLFSRMEQVRTALDQLSTGLQSWEGAAGEAYRGHLTELSGRVTQVVDTHRPVVQHLNSAADNVDAALSTIPIPDEIVDEAMRARQQFQATGHLDEKFHAGWFGDVLFPGFLNIAGDLLGWLTFGLSDKAHDMLRDFLSDGDDKAKAAYQALAGQHQGTTSSMNNFSGVIMDGQPYVFTPSMPTPTAPTMPSSGPGTGGFSGGGSAGAGPSLDPNEWNHGTTLAGAGGGGGPMPAIGTPSGAGGLGPIHGGGAAGAGGLGGGLGGGGMGAGGLAGAGMRPGGTTTAASAIRGGGAPMMGGMAGAGAGRGGAGARPGGGAGAGAGRGGGMGGMPMGAGGAAGARAGGGAGSGRPGVPGGVAAAKAGGAGGGIGGAAGRGGMAPMMGGAGGDGGDATDHSTWLQEDEDVWGTESDAAPPVLGS